jgi:hypothetical protein
MQIGITAYLLARSVLKVGWRLAMVRGEVEGRMSRLLASLATNSNSSPARLTCKEQFISVSSLSKVFPPIQYNTDKIPMLRSISFKMAVESAWYPLIKIRFKTF